MERANLLKLEADIIMNKYFYLFGNRYKEAYDKYNEAKNIYKLYKDHHIVVECLLGLLECEINMDNNSDCYSVNYELAQNYVQIDKNKSFPYFEKVITYYVRNGNMLMAAEIYEEISAIYHFIGNIEMSIESLQKAKNLYIADDMDFEKKIPMIQKCDETITNLKNQ